MERFRVRQDNSKYIIYIASSFYNCFAIVKNLLPSKDLMVSKSSKDIDL